MKKKKSKLDFQVWLVFFKRRDRDLSNNLKLIYFPSARTNAHRHQNSSSFSSDGIVFRALQSLRSHFDARRKKKNVGTVTQFCLHAQVTLAWLEINMSSNTRVWVIGQSSHVFLSFCSQLATGVRRIHTLCATRELAHAAANTLTQHFVSIIESSYMHKNR